MVNYGYMRKAPPKSHLYTIITLLAVLSLMGGIIVWDTRGRDEHARTGSTTSSEVPIQLIVEKSGQLSQITNHKGTFDLQSNSDGLQPATGISMYKNYDRVQDAARPN